VLVLCCSRAAGALPAGYVGQRVHARAIASLGGAEALAAGEPLVLAGTDRAFVAQVRRTLRAAGLDVQRTGARPAALPIPTLRHRRSRAA
jgi:hypothetical protein